uniref:Uncharacterized protein n=1 Tax=Heterorhabditis bacteriophora TaxID=37862 RepID=A0A1I7WVX3_HETBA
MTERRPKHNTKKNGSPARSHREITRQRKTKKERRKVNEHKVSSSVINFCNLFNNDDLSDGSDKNVTV